ncbi:uncharacterized protein VTP21DRAFT_7159 [Calcarisporiella thermophila]|uniref:uncharacterized protein n=1 Tax=Calcarisporiella thermophila TaxID=911321 RepID=UPI0037423328
MFQSDSPDTHPAANHNATNDLSSFGFYLDSGAQLNNFPPPPPPPPPQHHGLAFDPLSMAFSTAAADESSFFPPPASLSLSIHPHPPHHWDTEHTSSSSAAAAAAAAQSAAQLRRRHSLPTWHTTFSTEHADLSSSLNDMFTVADSEVDATISQRNKRRLSVDALPLAPQRPKKSRIDREGRKKSKDASDKKNKVRNGPKRPRNAFMHFLQSERANELMGEDNNISLTERVKLLAVRWNSMTEQEKEPYKIKFREEKGKYEEEIKVYQEQQRRRSSTTETDTDISHSLPPPPPPPSVHHNRCESQSEASAINAQPGPPESPVETAGLDPFFSFSLGHVFQPGIPISTPADITEWNTFPTSDIEQFNGSQHQYTGSAPHFDGESGDILSPTLANEKSLTVQISPGWHPSPVASANSTASSVETNGFLSQAFSPPMMEVGFVPSMGSDLEPHWGQSVEIHDSLY